MKSKKNQKIIFQKLLILLIARIKIIYCDELEEIYNELEEENEDTEK